MNYCFLKSYTSKLSEEYRSLILVKFNSYIFLEKKKRTLKKENVSKKKQISDKKIVELFLIDNADPDFKT